jgi:2-hydroxy-6-oxonona-2,4-dienedioate hydrolase
VNQKSFWRELSATDHSIRWVDAGGVSTRAIVAGASNAQPLVFLHGTTGHAEAYIRNLAEHAKHFKTYSVDMPGHGYTGASLHGYEIPAYARHLLEFMDAEGLEKIHLSGESLGGWVAAQFAMTYPDRVDRLVLNTSGGRTLDHAVMQRIKDTALAAVLTPDRTTVRRRLEWLMAHPETVTDELVEVRLAIYQQPTVQAEIKSVLCLQDEETRLRNLFSDAQLATIKAKTLVIWTSHDPSGGISVGQDFADHIPDARLAVMDDCGHWPQFESAAEFNRLHIDFLQA